MSSYQDIAVKKLSLFVTNGVLHKYTKVLFTPRFSLKDQIFFAKRLSFLIQAGVPLLESLSLIRLQTKQASKKAVFDVLINDVSSGQYLATSLARSNNLFSDFAINIIRVGETSGILTQNLKYLADELEKRRLLRNKVLGALIYPAFITTATLGVTTLLTVYIFPKILPIFVSLHVPLPLTTRILIAISSYLRSWGLLSVFLLCVLVAVFFIARARYPLIRMRADKALLYIPFAGKIARSYNYANFSRTLGLMLRAGVPISVAMDITAKTTPNRVYRESYETLSKGLLRGETLSRGLGEMTSLFPDILTHMVAVGEKTGSLSQTLVYLAELYESDIEDQTKNLSSSIEPILMLIMGLLVGLIAVSVITPIYAITQHLSPR